MFAHFNESSNTEAKLKLTKAFANACPVIHIDIMRRAFVLLSTGVNRGFSIFLISITGYASGNTAFAFE